MSIKLRDIFSPDTVQLDLVSHDKSAAIRELASLLKKGVSFIDEEKTIQVLLEREQLGSTAIGEGVAIPHGKLEGLERVVGAFARSKGGLDFESYDQKKTHLFFVLLAPEGRIGISDHLKALAKISRLLRSPEFRDQLLMIDDKHALYQHLVSADR